MPLKNSSSCVKLFSVFALRWGGLDTLPDPARQAQRAPNPARAGRQGVTERSRLGHQYDPPRAPRSGGGQPRSGPPCAARARRCDTSAPPAHPARARPGRSTVRAAHLPGGGPRCRSPHPRAPR
ncbi:hypothetical protein NDU88_002452 [Pleurodeles waltl]|uniref:Uncharacterized protein n=1 Tax=Pleurodeles waltl TaxID=8319 RepID=A0AAV7T2G0_PLEWA|nr:hypothetical protein NDU88_002452 [Pleurodeles waltl]